MKNYVIYSYQLRNCFFCLNYCQEKKTSGFELLNILSTDVSIKQQQRKKIEMRNLIASQKKLKLRQLSSMIINSRLKMSVSLNQASRLLRKKSKS